MYCVLQKGDIWDLVPQMTSRDTFVCLDSTVDILTRATSCFCLPSAVTHENEKECGAERKLGYWDHEVTTLSLALSTGTYRHSGPFSFLFSFLNILQSVRTDFNQRYISATMTWEVMVKGTMTTVLHVSFIWSRVCSPIFHQREASKYHKIVMEKLFLVQYCTVSHLKHYLAWPLSVIKEKQPCTHRNKLSVLVD